MKVISWCFYFDCVNVSRFAEYLVGLKCNQRAARFWFPDWHCRLYYDAESVKDHPCIWNFIRDVCMNGSPQIELIPKRLDYPIMTERYRPFFEPGISVTIVRDIDSVLSKVDADCVNKWFYESSSHILQYREIKMGLDYVMGGGIGFRGSLDPLEEIKYIQRLNSHGGVPTSPTNKKSTVRGYDEEILSFFIRDKFSLDDRKIVTTRMTQTGLYYLYDGSGDLSDNPSDYEILWAVPFYDARLGYACYYSKEHCYLEDPQKIDEIVKFVENFPIKRELTGVHWCHHKDKIDQIKTCWVR